MSRAMPLTNGSTPMKPIDGSSLAACDEMLAAAEADLQPDGRHRRLEQSS